MIKEWSFSMSTSKLSSLPETTATSSALYITSDALNAEIRPAVKCVTFHYSQRNMDESPHLLAMIFRESKIAGYIILDRIKYGLKRHFLEKYGIGKKCKSFVILINSLIIFPIISIRIQIYFLMMRLLIARREHRFGHSGTKIWRKRSFRLRNNCASSS